MIKISSTGAVSTVASFTGTGGATKGNQPIGMLANDGSGNFWGTTLLGGANNLGTLFKVDISTGALTTIVDFTGAAGAAKGKQPIGALFNDGAGTLWGTTSQGGTTGFGTIFKVAIASGVLTTVAEFTGTAGPARGALPYGDLIADGAGGLCGTTSQGGSTNIGTIFKLDPTTGVVTTLVDFTGVGGRKSPGPHRSRASFALAVFSGARRPVAEPVIWARFSRWMLPREH